MKYKKILPYVLTMAAFMPTATSANMAIEDDDKKTDPKYIAMVPKSDAALYKTDANMIETATYAISASPKGKSVVYTNNRGGQVERTGGTRAWRNNNPGCLRYGPRACEMGAIGHAGGFAVFPDEETGRGAIIELLLSSTYRNLTIARAIAKYAPPHENNTKAYMASLAKKTGLALGKLIRDLTMEQLELVANAIAEIEGWKAGKIIELAPDTVATVINMMSHQR